jgi:hypothetical protein
MPFFDFRFRLCGENFFQSPVVFRIMKVKADALGSIGGRLYRKGYAGYNKVCG